MSEFIATDIAERLRHVLEKRKFKPGEIAREAGVSSATVSHWLKGKNLTFDTLDFICSKLHVSLDWLVCGHGCMEITNSQLNREETWFIYVLRHIDQSLAQPLLHMLESVQHYHHRKHTLAAHPGKNQIFDTGQTFHLAVNSQGFIVQGDDNFYNAIGIDNENQTDEIYAFDLVAPDYQARAKQAFTRLLLTGKSTNLYLEFINRNNQKRIGMIIKGSLSMVNSELLVDTIIKPLNQIYKNL